MPIVETFWEKFQKFDGASVLSVELCPSCRALWRTNKPHCRSPCWLDSHEEGKGMGRAMEEE